MVVGADLVFVDEVPVQIVQLPVPLLHGGPAEDSRNVSAGPEPTCSPTCGFNSHVTHQAGVLCLNQHVPDVVGVVGHFCS